MEQADQKNVVSPIFVVNDIIWKSLQDPATNIGCRRKTSQSSNLRLALDELQRSFNSVTKSHGRAGILSADPDGDFPIVNKKE